MQQTLLALAALVAFSIWALTRNQDDSELEQRMLTTEVESAAAEAAVARMGEITRLSFDEADVGRTGARTGTTGLTAPGGFGPDGMMEGSEPGFDDVDDFHGSTRSFKMLWDADSLAFTERVEVSYYDAPTEQAVSARRLAKQITVEVMADQDGFVGTPPTVARLRRIVTPAFDTTH